MPIIFIIILLQCMVGDKHYMFSRLGAAGVTWLKCNLVLNPSYMDARKRLGMCHILYLKSLVELDVSLPFLWGRGWGGGVGGGSVGDDRAISNSLLKFNYTIA